MKRTGCSVGVVLLLLAAASALVGIVMAQAAPGPISLGWLWFQIHGNSLVGFQALIENGLSPALWPPLQFLLTIPSWLLLVPLGLLLLVLCRPRSAGR